DAAGVSAPVLLSAAGAAPVLGARSRGAGVGAVGPRQRGGPVLPRADARLPVLAVARGERRARHRDAGRAARLDQRYAAISRRFLSRDTQVSLLRPRGSPLSLL